MDYKKRNIFIEAMQNEVGGLTDEEFVALYNMTRLETETKIYPIEKFNHMLQGTTPMDLLGRIDESYYHCVSPDYFWVGDFGMILFEEADFLVCELRKDKTLYERLVDDSSKYMYADEAGPLLFNALLECAKVYKAEAMSAYIKKNVDEISRRYVKGESVESYNEELDVILDTSLSTIVYDFEKFKLEDICND